MDFNVDKSASLTPEIKSITHDMGTEMPHSGAYCNVHEAGSYLCRVCGHVLYRSEHKFSSNCGWPSFDESVGQAITRILDSDGRRMEIRCAHCQCHLGHVFEGEGFTAANTRFCVNSLCLDFVSSTEVQQSEEVILGGGCFWGVQAKLNDLSGVIFSEVGYCGGDVPNPSYELVCQGKSGHVETCRVIFDTKLVSLEEVMAYFLSIHDPTQANGQGPDIGAQYQSVVFCHTPQQRLIVQKEMAKMVGIQTQVRTMSTFWPAEAYHQNYHQRILKR